MRHMSTAFGFLLFLFVPLGCSNTSSGLPPKTENHDAGGTHVTGTDYLRIPGRSLAAMAQFSLCKLARHPMFGSAGAYRVERLTGVTEEDLWNPGTVSGFTYVELALVQGWHKAEKKTVVRILGGPFPNGRTGGWRVDLSVGEVVGLLLLAPVPNNRGYAGIHELGVFKKRPDGGFSNGQLFTTKRADLVELGKHVSAFSGRAIEDACPSDVLPDVGGERSAATPPAGDESTHVMVTGTRSTDGGVN